MPKPKHILVIRLSAMGDVAMTVPVLRALILQYPDLKITVLTRAFFEPFFRDLPNVSVYHAEIKNKHKGIFGLYKLSRALKKHNIDAVADLHNVLRSKILRPLLAVKKVAVINKGRKDKRALVTGEIKRALKTTHHRYCDVFKALGYPISLDNPTFPKPVVLNQFGILKDEKNWIGIAPFAQYESKMYPLYMMESVVETLSLTYKVLLFGGGTNEEKTLEKWANKYDNVYNLAGKYDLNEELDVISNLDVMLSMDSGNAHIAAMLGVKVITIWGVTHPNAGFMPFNQKLSNALVADINKYPQIPTSVYGNKYPESYKTAAGSISEEVVIRKVKALI